MARILVVGLNPAWQKIYDFTVLNVGAVNRVRRLSAIASGKGLNAARVLRRFGHDVELLQIVGGDAGRRVVEACTKLGIRSLHVEVPEETRTCHTFMDASTGAVTEIIEPFDTDRSQVLDALIGLLPSWTGDAVLFCGTAPGGVPSEVFLRVAEQVEAGLMLLDGYQGLPVGFLDHVDFIKVNRLEYESLSQASVASHISVDKSSSPYRAPTYLVTDGPADAFIASGDSGAVNVTFKLPSIGPILNPIGAGDTVTAGFVHHALQGDAIEEAFRHGLAMGSASCLSELPAHFDDRRLAELHAQIKVMPLEVG